MLDRLIQHTIRAYHHDLAEREFDTSWIARQIGKHGPNYGVKAYRNLLVYVGRDDDQLPAIFLLGMKPECRCDSQQFFHASQDPAAVFNIAIYHIVLYMRELHLQDQKRQNRGPPRPFCERRS